MLTGIVALVYFSGALDADSQLKLDSPALESNVRSGLLGAVAVFLGIPKILLRGRGVIDWSAAM